VEVPAVFTRPTQMASRIGNTTLTGNERIDGNFLVNGSLTLDGERNNEPIVFDSYDMSNLIVHQSSSLNYVYGVSFDIAHTATINDLIVNGHSDLNGVSCETISVNTSYLENASISFATLEDLTVNGHSDLNGLSCENLSVNGNSFLTFGILEDLSVNGHSDLVGVSCETLEVNGTSFLNDAYAVDLDVSSLTVDSCMNVLGHSDLVGLSCETLQVNGNTLFKDTISYNDTTISDLSLVVWIVCGESARVGSNLTTSNIFEGNIFGKKYWALTVNEYITVEHQTFNTSEWTVAIAFGVVNSKSGTLFSADTSNNIVLNGQNLIVNQHSSGLNIPSFSVLTVTKSNSYSVYINGILEYSSTPSTGSSEQDKTQFGGIGVQILACAVWSTVLTDIQSITLEALT
jgi:hypothetical protein